MSDGIHGTDELPLQGPNLRWGEPAGVYEIEIVPGGCMFFYRALQPCGAKIEIKIPMNLLALGEMIALLNMLDLPNEFKPELPNVRIRGHA